MSTNRYSPFVEYSLGNAEEENLEVDSWGQVPSARYLNCWRYSIVKRTFDVVVASTLLLLLFLPAGCVIALFILLSSPGPIFYREERIGRFGRRFKIWKFRTMRKDAAQAKYARTAVTGSVDLEWRMQKHLKDPRITPIGNILRSWSMDELPQLINVVRGEMSLIGPRPIVDSECSLYGDLLSYYLDATPGMTGIWQVSGRNQVNYEQRAQLDRHYANSWSLLLDFKILARTVPAVLRRIGAS